MPTTEGGAACRRNRRGARSQEGARPGWAATRQAQKTEILMATPSPGLPTLFPGLKVLYIRHAPQVPGSDEISRRKSHRRTRCWQPGRWRTRGVPPQSLAEFRQLRGRQPAPGLELGMIHQDPRGADCQTAARTPANGGETGETAPEPRKATTAALPFRGWRQTQRAFGRSGKAFDGCVPCVRIAMLILFVDLGLTNAAGLLFQ
jgi:hypothetical protein